VISLAGGILGIGLATFMTGMVRNAPGMFIAQLRQLTLLPPVAAACLGIAAAIGLLSALIPAFNASRISILQALRSTD